MNEARSCSRLRLICSFLSAHQCDCKLPVRACAGALCYCAVFLTSSSTSLYSTSTPIAVNQPQIIALLAVFGDKVFCQKSGRDNAKQYKIKIKNFVAVRPI